MACAGTRRRAGSAAPAATSRSACKDGKVVAIAGDQQAEVNKGLLCVKGYHVGTSLYGKDRLTTPLLRKDGQARPDLWDEAHRHRSPSAIMADPAGFAMYGAGQWTIPEGYAAQQVHEGRAGEQPDRPNARLCMASAVTGLHQHLRRGRAVQAATTTSTTATCSSCGATTPPRCTRCCSRRFIDRQLAGDKVTLIDLDDAAHAHQRARRPRRCVFQPQATSPSPTGIAHQLIEAGTVATGRSSRSTARSASLDEADDPPTLDGPADARSTSTSSSLAEYTPERGRAKTLGRAAPSSSDCSAGCSADGTLRITSLWCMGMNQHTRAPRSTTSSTASTCSAGTSASRATRRPVLTGQPSACGTVREVGTLVARAARRPAWSTKPEHRREGREALEPPAGPHQRRSPATTPCRCGRGSAPRRSRAATSTRSGCR